MEKCFPIALNNEARLQRNSAGCSILRADIYLNAMKA
jgi:hypothetical protein